VTGQNVYDDPDFFAAYQQMREARSGINETVEQPAVRALVGDVRGKDAIDLGCGDGGLCRDLMALGARSVVGIDPSARMLELAAWRTTDERVRYIRGFAEDAGLPAGSADLVVSSLALHYVPDLGPLLRRIASWLRPGGRLVASMEHPVRTASPELGRHPLVVDRYASEGRRDTTWYIDGVVKYHRRLSSIVNGIIDAGLVLERLAEPTPSPAAVAARPDLADHARSPAILVVAAHNTASWPHLDSGAGRSHSDAQ
jgi:SAM-dependent methyltransferase